MLTAKKFDEVAFVRDQVDEYEKKNQEIAKAIAWQKEEREQEFKQALLEGRGIKANEGFKLDLFKLRVWLR